ncbi:MAG: GNAT family N-acetyltransferase [Saezia sp.]
MTAPYLLTTLATSHNRSGFACGSSALDNYFKKQVTQDIRRKVTACFVAVTDDKCIAGYYTLASASVLLSELPEKTSKKLPRYPTVPAVRLGRLAVDQNLKGQGLGGALLADAFLRASRSEIAAYALIVDAKDGQAVAFYEYHGLIKFPNSPLMLFLPLTKIPNDDTVRAMQEASAIIKKRQKKIL